MKEAPVTAVRGNDGVVVPAAVAGQRRDLSVKEALVGRCEGEPSVGALQDADIVGAHQDGAGGVGADGDGVDDDSGMKALPGAPRSGLPEPLRSLGCPRGRESCDARAGAWIERVRRSRRPASDPSPPIQSTPMNPLVTLAIASIPFAAAPQDRDKELRPPSEE